MADDPPSVLSNRDELAAWLDDADGLLLGLDFDGTLVPIVSDPSKAGIAARVKGSLRELAETPSVRVAVVSGRALDDLVDRVGVDGPIYAGNHGLEIDDGDTTLVHPKAEAQRSIIKDLSEELRANLVDVPGAMVEDKGLTATVHFRQADDPEKVISTVETLASTANADVRISSGKAVRELRPAVDWDKGAAMSLLLDRVPDGFRAMYVGDDETDEDAFEVVDEEGGRAQGQAGGGNDRAEGVGVRVGSDTGPETAASYQLSNQEMAPEFLEFLVGYASDRWGDDEGGDEDPVHVATGDGWTIADWDED